MDAGFSVDCLVPRSRLANAAVHVWWTTVARSGSPDSRIHTIVIVGVTAFTIKLAEYFLRCGHSMSIAYLRMLLS